MRKRSPSQRFLAWLHGAILLIACLSVLVPLAYLVINSLKLPREFLTIPPTILPSEVTLQHYEELLDDKKTVRYFRNSLTVAVWTTGITILTGTLAAYGLGADAAGGARSGGRDLHLPLHSLLSARHNCDSFLPCHAPI